ncbi:hypothetical protein [Vibrio genomosp. F6]|uniref:Sel1 repeat family protein n=1 Tax=Vibrio genomosp. F6 str. FF-238 TaxID=1191298 RepID=A0A1E5CW35_9VIBR|nr:hypothetical protein [Vibrio genomosp. F6]OEE74295.1 hypothetical protein A130_18060 [Vibrio genomosp. F6 str. FF-238]
MKLRLVITLLFSPLLLAAPICHASLEQAMALVQQGKFAQAEPFLYAEANAGNRDAMYWLGFTLQQQNFLKGVEAGAWYYKSAELGDPWAMAKMSHKRICNFLDWNCPTGKKAKEWGKIQRAAWEKMAANGDGNAQQALAYSGYGWKDYFAFLRLHEKVRRLKKAVKMGPSPASKALADVLEDKQEIIKYHLIAANNGYVPAMTVLAGYEKVLDHEVILHWLHTALELGSSDAALLLKHGYYEGSYGLPKDDEKQYYYSLLYTGLGTNSGFFMGGYLEDKLTPEQIERIEKQAAEWLTTHPKNFFYDVTSTMYD